MTGLLEVAAKIAADKARVAELAALLAAAKDQAEETAGALHAVGAERSAAGVRQAATAVEEAESLRSALEGGLEKAHWQVMSAVHGNLGPGARGSGPGGAHIAADGRVTALGGGPVDTHLDAIPPHLRQDPTPTGDELTGIDPSIGPFQKEHQDADADRGKNRLARAARLGVRNAGDLKKGGQQLVAGTNSDVDSFGPPPGGYSTTTQVPEHTPQIHSVPVSQPNATDIVGSAIVLAVVIADGAGRLIERGKRRKRKNDGR